MAMAFADIYCDERDYERWVSSLTKASARLDVLETAVTELCRLCESQDVRSEQVLKVLESHGAITKGAHRRSAAA